MQLMSLPVCDSTKCDAARHSFTAPMKNKSVAEIKSSRLKFYRLLMCVCCCFTTLTFDHLHVVWSGLHIKSINCAFPTHMLCQVYNTIKYMIHYVLKHFMFNGLFWGYSGCVETRYTYAAICFLLSL